MGFISWLCFFFAFILAPIILVMSLVAPAKLDIKTDKNPNGKSSRKDFLIGLGLLCVIAVVVGGLTSPDDKDTVPNSPTTQPDIDKPSTHIADDNSQATAKQNKTFGMTPDEFTKKWSAKAKSSGLGDNQLPRFDIQKGSVNDTFTASLSQGVAMIGTVDKATGNLKGIMYVMGHTEKGDQEIMLLLATASVTAQVLSPELSVDETGGKVASMTTKAVEDYAKNHDSSNQSAVVGNVKYSAGWIDKMGFMLGFDPA